MGPGFNTGTGGRAAAADRERRRVSQRPASLLQRVLERAFAVPAVYRLRQLLIRKDPGGVYRRLLGGIAGKSVLEIGCGPGTNVSILAAADSYLGIDINPRYLETARRLFPARDFQTADARVFAPDRRFGLILIDSFLHHIADDQVTTLLGRARSWLAEGGVIVVHEPLVPAPFELFHGLWMRLDRGDFFRRLDHWRALVASAGLEVVDLVLYEQRIVAARSHHMAGMRLADRLSTKVSDGQLGG